MTKIDIFSGFLGAGKTTLIKKLIAEAFQGEKVVLIENEFGEIGIDGGFLQDAGIQITEMNSGCICCSLVGDFSKALKKVEEEYHPERILIEPSGVGKLSDVIRAVERAELCDTVINSFTTVVDAKKCKMYLKNFGEFFGDQIEHAACVAMSHTDTLSEEKLAEAVALVREHNPSCTVITTDWKQIDGKRILEAMEHTDTLEDELKKLEKEAHHHHGEECDDPECECHHHGEAHHHHADEVFTSFGRETSKTFTKDQIERALKALEDGTYGVVLRAKGIVKGEKEWIHFDYVPGEADVRTGSADVIGKLCVIGCKLDEEALSKLFAL